MINLEEMVDLDLLQCLVYGEARGESLTGKVAVAWVAKNRVSSGGWWGSTWKEVILKPYQFSCFLRGDHNLERIEDAWEVRWSDVWMRESRLAAYGVLEGWVRDPTKGADHYHAYYVSPSWQDLSKKTCKIGNHHFYALGKGGDG